MVLTGPRHSCAELCVGFSLPCVPRPSRSSCVGLCWQSLARPAAAEGPVWAGTGSRLGPRWGCRPCRLATGVRDSLLGQHWGAAGRGWVVSGVPLPALPRFGEARASLVRSKTVAEGWSCPRPGLAGAGAEARGCRGWAGQRCPNPSLPYRALPPGPVPGAGAALSPLCRLPPELRAGAASWEALPGPLSAVTVGARRGGRWRQQPRARPRCGDAGSGAALSRRRRRRRAAFSRRTAGGADSLSPGTGEGRKPLSRGERRREAGPARRCGACARPCREGCHGHQWCCRL